jgi:ribosomal protein S18 acetylase RimI-like enzyme
VDPDVAAAALIETWQVLVSAVPDGWTRAERGAVAMVTGVPWPTLNGAWVGSVDVATELVEDLLGQLAATGLPHCLQTRPGAAAQLTGLAAARGLTPARPIPLMVLEDPEALGAELPADGLVIRELAPAEAHVHAGVAAAGFEAPVEPFLQLMTPSVLAAPGVRCYLGEVDGEPVSTGLGVTIGSYVAIFNVATPPAHRGRGFAAALTARAVTDGLARGARWSWLQSSEAGYRVYERLGFRTVEDWRCWLTGAAHD